MTHTRNADSPLDASLPPPGAALAAARMAKGFALEDIARLLKLSVAQVNALESGDHSRLPSAVFVRGFTRSYARLVDLDIEPLLPAKAAPAANRDVHLMHRSSSVAIEPDPYRRAPAWLMGVACVLLGLAYYEFVFNAPPATSSAPAPVASAPAVSTQPAASAAQAGVLARGDSAQAAAPQASAAGAENEQLILKKSSEPLSESAGRDGLHFVFNGESWVEVRDRAGRVVYSKSNASGTESLVRGDPPLSVVIGAASAVKLSYNGSPVDLAMHATADVARLRLE
jgi:cytoskeleton protein RodZ